MELYSTNGQSPNVGLREAVFRGLPPDNGLYMPTAIPQLSESFFAQLPELEFSEIAFRVCDALIGDEVPADALWDLVEDAFDFPVPVVQVEENLHVLELFHGPSLAFKDFGARFMSRLMGHFLKTQKQKITILVATSGDTGSAVGQGFLGVDGIDVVILYPSGKVSPSQEKQLTTLGQNVVALEIDGVFDDCQRLVKQAFLDEDLRKKMTLSSANSINIARLIPQSLYYFSAWAALAKTEKPVAFCTPSGNFGNLCGGLIAANMGLPVEKFVAATNANHIVPTYLDTGLFEAKPSVATISNAMDVGNPSNFPRLLALNDNDEAKIKERVMGTWFTDEQTSACLNEVYAQHDYVMCPHTAVGYLGMQAYLKKTGSKANGVVLGTAHPAKFSEVVAPLIGQEPQMPAHLAEIIAREKKSHRMGPDFDALKSFLLNR